MELLRSEWGSLQGYMPGQYYNLNSAYGSPDELRAAVAEIKKAGLAPMADIVINHRCADKQDESGVWNNFKCVLHSVMAI